MGYFKKVYTTSEFGGCAVDLGEYAKILHTKTHKLIKILNNKNFHCVHLKVEYVIEELRNLLGTQYKLSAIPTEAPYIFSCSTLVRYIYGYYLGIKLPKKSYQQAHSPNAVLVPNEIQYLEPLDVIYKSGPISRYYNNSKKGIGHALIYTGEGTVIHAKNKEQGVIEEDANMYLKTKSYLRIVRFLPTNPAELYILRNSKEMIEQSDDIFKYFR